MAKKNTRKKTIFFYKPLDIYKIACYYIRVFSNKFLISHIFVSHYCIDDLQKYVIFLFLFKI